MDATYVTYLVVCPLCFLAGLLNASGGGGGFVSLPAMLIAGLPPHLAIGTNKLQSALGMAAANVRFIRSHLLDIRLAAASIFVAVLGSLIGSRLSLYCDGDVLKYIMLGVLPIAALPVFNRRMFSKERSDMLILDRHTYLAVCASSLVIGAYDGFYGPGTGTFLIIAYMVLGHLSIRRASANAKAVNFATNLAALVVFLINGQVDIVIGLVAGGCNILGAWLGAGLIIDLGAKVMKPAILVSIVLMALKVFGVY